MASKQDLAYDEKTPSISPVDNGVTGFETEESALPPGYFRSSYFIGSMTAICLGLFAGVSGFAYAAPILTIINQDIGPVRILLLTNEQQLTSVGSQHRLGRPVIYNDLRCLSYPRRTCL